MANYGKSLAFKAAPPWELRRPVGGQGIAGCAEILGHDMKTLSDLLRLKGHPADQFQVLLGDLG